MSLSIIIGSIAIISIFCCISLCSSSIIGSYYWNQSSLNALVKNNPNILHVAPSAIFGQCPTDWRKTVYANGAQCVAPNAFAIVDSQNNYVAFKTGTCTKGYVASTALAMRMDPTKQYFCESL